MHRRDAMNINIRKANCHEHSILTEISFAAKRYWNYPEEYFEIWKEELTITQEYIEKNIVYVAEIDGEVIGFFSIVNVPEDFWTGKVFVEKGFWLDHLFIRPEYIRKGVGTKLMRYVNYVCKEKGIKCLNIFSDPNAKGFYDKIGARYIGESPSSIENRTVSMFEYEINSKR